MADPAEFSPAELDDLEDALEQLESPNLPTAAPNVRRRLDEYRHIVALSRSALPMVDVPTGLLDGVLAQARAAAEVPSIVPTAAASTPAPGIWSRLRRFALLPGVALAGAAAVVLVVVERNPKHEVAAAPVATAAEAGPKGAAANEQPAAAAAPVQRSLIETESPAKPTSTPEAAKKAEGRADLDVESRLEEASERKPKEAPPTHAELEERLADVTKSEDDGQGAAGAMPSAPGAVPSSPAPAADSSTPRWDIIARGDRARHRGDCRAARNEYALALADGDTRVRARAHAGLGLCDAADGDRTSADAAYRAARELDGEVIAFIDDERPRSGAGASTPKAARAKPMSKKNATAD